MPALIYWRHGPSCAQAGQDSIALLIPFALLLASLKNPWRAVAACLAYLPIGYALSVEPCLPAHAQGAGGLLYVIWPAFVVWVAGVSWLGGAILIRMVPIKEMQEPLAVST
ncbi:MAG: hypothetical protein IPK97_09390 [Ahniella sp.]|nr:hypothetical protein [Ahniella sp.]